MNPVILRRRPSVKHVSFSGYVNEEKDEYEREAGATVGWKTQGIFFRLCERLGWCNAVKERPRTRVRKKDAKKARPNI